MGGSDIHVSVYLPVWVTCISVFTCVGGSDTRVSVYLPVWVTCIGVFTCVGGWGIPVAAANAAASCDAVIACDPPVDPP